MYKIIKHCNNEFFAEGGGGGLIQWIVSILGQNAVIDYNIVALSDIDKLNVVQPGQLFRWLGRQAYRHREAYNGTICRYFTWGMRVNTGI